MTETDEVRRRFWEKVDVRGPDECWEWQAYRDAYNGYGRFAFMGGSMNASRVVWFLENGDPGDLSVLHKCDNPPCVNPSHLYLGTQVQNVRDAIERGGMEGKTSLSLDDVREIKRRLKRGEKHRDIAEDYGVGKTTVTDINTETTWADVRI